MKETDLYIPVKTLLAQEGFDVYGEVNHVDITAIKENTLVIVELKTQYNLKLILQAAKRQKITEFVYIAIPRPQYKKRFGKDFKDKEYLLKRLGIGLIFVALDSEVPFAQIVFEPKPYSLVTSRSHSQGHLKAIKNEIENRGGDFNLGGTKGKIMTAYREQALKLAHHLSKYEKLTTKELKALSGIEKTSQYLRNNYYDWFTKVERSLYMLNESGFEALAEYKDYFDALKSANTYTDTPTKP